jgi:hypothetical protein
MRGAHHGGSPLRSKQIEDFATCGQLVVVVRVRNPQDRCQIGFNAIVDYGAGRSCDESLGVSLKFGFQLFPLFGD